MTATLNTVDHYEGTWVRAQSTEPNYALRRTVVGIIAALVVLLAAVSSVTAVGALTGLGGRPAAASEAAPVLSEVVTKAVHVAEPGDSLWSIAEVYRGDASRQRYVDALIDLNGGTAIQAGQAVRLP